jgi:hypothetical protein
MWQAHGPQQAQATKLLACFCCVVGAEMSVE